MMKLSDHVRITRSATARARGWTLALGACILAALAVDSQSQSSGQPRVRTTGSGVYTAEQALKGKDVYAGNCTSCHTPSQHSGTAFLGTWSGRQLWDLYELISETMPQTDPGSLPPEEYAQLMAYLLQLNRMPAGKVALPSEAAALKLIRIDTASAPRR